MCIKNDQARFAAKSLDIFLEKVDGGFFLFHGKKGEQLGHPDMLDQPWTAEQVLDFCATFHETLCDWEPKEFC